MPFSPAPEQDQASPPAHEEVTPTTAEGTGRGGPRPSRVGLAALTIGLLSMAVRASVLRDAYFITDDYMLMSRAMESGLTFDYLTRVHTGHFEPIGFAVMWLLAHYAPFSWAWASVFLLGSQVLLLVLVWQLLIELFGRRPGVLLPFAMLAFSPLTIAAFTWLSAGIIWLPLMISMAGVLRFHIRFIRDGGVRNAVYAMLWFVVGLASFEKILIILPFLLLLTVAVHLSLGRRPRDLARSLVGQWPVWCGYGALTVVYLFLYIRGSRGAGASMGVAVPDAVDLGDFVALSLGRTFVPGTLGGPWDWARQSYGLAVVDSPRFFDWVAWIVLVAFIVGAIAVRRYAGVYWASLGLYLAASLAIIALGRVAYLGPVFALETRYLADAVVPLVVVVGACLMPLRGESDHLTPDGHLWRDRVRRHRVRAFALATTIIVVLSLNAIARYSAYSSDNPTRAFMANMTADLEALPAGAELVDTWLPENVLSPFFGEYNRTSRLVSPLVDDETRATLLSRNSYTVPYILGPDGHITPMTLTVFATGDPPSGVCRVQSDGRVSVDLTSDLYGWDWVVRIGYLSEVDFTATVTFGERSTSVPMTRGLGGVYVSLAGSGDTIEITDIPPLANFCVGDVHIGTATPQP